MHSVLITWQILTFAVFPFQLRFLVIFYRYHLIQAIEDAGKKGKKSAGAKFGGTGG